MNRFTLLAPCLFTFLSALATGCAGETHDVRATEMEMTALQAPAAASTSRDLADPLSGIRAMTADADTLYLASNGGKVFSLPKAGGEPNVLVSERSRPGGLAVDDGYLYFSGAASGTIARIPKAGGALEVLARGLRYPGAIAIDAAHVYVVVEDAASPPGPAIVRVPRDGGQAEVVAAAQPFVTALVLGQTDVYFATGYDEPDGSIRRVAKDGGEVQVLATGIDTRNPMNPMVAREVKGLVIDGDRIAFVEPFTRKVAFVPLAGGAVSRSTGSSFMPSALGRDGSSLLAVSFEDASGAAKLVRLDTSGAATSTLASWSYEPRTFPAAISPASAIAVDSGEVFWADWDLDPSGRILSTIRSAPVGDTRLVIH